MNFEKYQKKCLRTFNTNSQNENLCKLSMGISGEAGEITDYIKKVVFHGHDLNVEKIKEEVGDLIWYIAVLLWILNIDINDVLKSNIKKLQQRYPNGFNSNESEYRK